MFSPSSSLLLDRNQLDPAAEARLRLTVTSSSLYIHEELWRGRYHFLEAQGYKLRPRYHPHWKPSEKCRDRHDAIRTPHARSVDATRQSDGKLVFIKRVATDSEELKLLDKVHSGYFKAHPANRCVPILDRFQDCSEENVTYLVMPFLRPVDPTKLKTVSELINLYSQVILGIEFLHRRYIAHRDPSLCNVMAEESALYPKGFHPVRLGYLPDGVTPAQRLPPTPHRPITYYLVDFEVAVHVPKNSYFSFSMDSRTVNGLYGRDRGVPELNEEAHRRRWGDYMGIGEINYNPFKVDIWIAGKMLMEVTQYFSEGDTQRFSKFLAGLTDEHHSRFTATKAREKLCEILHDMPLKGRSERLRPVDENYIETVIKSSAHYLGIDRVCALAIGLALYPMHRCQFRT